MFNIDSQKIAEGLFDLIPDFEKDFMRYGVLPKIIMDIVERHVREHIVLLYRPNASSSELKRLVPLVKSSVVNPIMKDISISLLKIATEKGICKV